MKYILLIFTIVYLLFAVDQTKKLRGADKKWGIPGVLMGYAAAVLVGISTYEAFCGSDNLIEYFLPAMVLSTVGGYLSNKGHGEESFKEDILPMLIGFTVAGVTCLILFLID